ncbi:hypothetical protein SAMN05428967_4477 [Phyllobacterium sp. YR620]|uniref:DUF6950 family protein n=1 Tax=Phyllobacterium sp. YR620 TaxID=1881066 RepID=UPI00088C63FC|nr:hypothetical protein [Phyllobacterium sp. YR620]SDP92545.1 hypothetical protein SAMN05428967_4477 [Phyllobacterium sp. YR620]
MTRFQIVEATLNAELAKPYQYGVADCFFLGIAMIDALSGSDHRTGFAKAYRTLAGAQRALRKRGHVSLVTLFDTIVERCAPAEARLGDVVILQLGEHEHVGICLGSRFVTKMNTGKSYHNLTDCIAAFRAG